MIAPFEVQVRFVDIDLLGHVNNAVYFSYLEMTRVYYLEKLLGEQWDYTQDGFLLVRNEMDYLKPIFLYQTPKIRMFVEHIGRRSFTFGYEIIVENELVTKAKSVMVAWNISKNSAIEIPERLRVILESDLKK
ncbi:MAG: acyl-CoA thioesterase [Bacteroidetes bacterium]|nr:acyl-CoA thioesterase [Bacteroidota bacterium]